MTPSTGIRVIFNYFENWDVIIKSNFITWLYTFLTVNCAILQWRSDNIERRGVLNYSVPFYVYDSLPRGISISDNTASSTTRKIVSYHSEMASPRTMFTSLSLFFLFLLSLSLWLTCRCRRLDTPDPYTCKRIPDINLPTSVPHSAPENASRDGYRYIGTILPAILGTPFCVTPVW